MTPAGVDGAVLYVKLLNPVELEIAATPSARQGAATKTATLVTGAQIQVPQSAATGDMVKVGSRDGSYLGTVKG